MPKQSPFRNKEKAEKARKLYREGLTTREIGKIINMSHTWVHQQVKKLSTELPLQ